MYGMLFTKYPSNTRTLNTNETTELLTLIIHSNLYFLPEKNKSVKKLRQKSRTDLLFSFCLEFGCRKIGILSSWYQVWAVWRVSGYRT